jgi:hypothetical protein
VLKTVDSATGKADFSLDYFDTNKTQIIERKIVPDSSQLYTLDYQRSALSEDTLTLTIDSDGLLKKIESSTEDKTGQIILKLIETAKEAAKAAALAVAGVATQTGDYVFAPENVDAINKRIKADLGEEAPQITIDPPVLPSPPTARCDGDGVCFRPLRPYVVTVTLGGRPFRSETVLLPNEAPILSLPVHRAAFVKNVTNATFNQGILTEVHIEKPSELLAFFEIPLAVAKAIAAVPAELLQVKIDYSSKEKQLADAQKAQLEATQALLNAQRMGGGTGSNANPSPLGQQ